jgi:hypothetical protein
MRMTRRRTGAVLATMTMAMTLAFAALGAGALPGGGALPGDRSATPAPTPAAGEPAAPESGGGAAQPEAGPATATATFTVGGAHRMPLVPTGPQSASAPAGSHLNYYGGHVLPHVKTYAVIWGAGTYFPQITGGGTPSASSFLGGVTNSSYMDWLNEFDTNITSFVGGAGTNQRIGRGSFAGKITITPSAANNGATIDDATNIQPELNAQITAGNLPAPDENTLYVLFFRQGQTITQGGATSMVQFCAYHGTFTRNAKSVAYAVMPDFTPALGGGCGNNATPFNNVTSVISHEMIEAVTDAEVGLATVYGPPLAWYDPTNGEIGDICNAQQGSVVGGDSVTYVVQTEFSNSVANCIVTKAMPNDFSVSAPATASLNPGSSTMLTVSSATTLGVAQSVALSVSGLPAGVSASFAPASVTSGSSSTLTLTATATVVPTMATLTVNGAGTANRIATSALTVTNTPTVTWAAPAAINYGAALSATQLNATASVPGSFVYSPVAGTVLHAGVGQTLSVTFTPTSASYAAVGQSVAITVNPSPLTLTAPSGAVQYSDPKPALTTVTGSGFLNGDTLASLTGSATCTTTATTTPTGLITSHAGSYPVSCSGLTSADYTITNAPGTLTVSPEKAFVTMTGTAPVVSAPTASTPVALQAKVTQQLDGHPGYLPFAQVKFSVFKSTNTSVFPDYTAVAAASSSGTVAVTINLPIDTYTVFARVALTSPWFASAQSPMSVVTLVSTAPPGSSSASGGGTVSETVGSGSFGFNISHLAASPLAGTYVYTYRTGAGNDVIVKQTGWLGGGQTYSPGTAEFTGSATYIVINPNTGAPVAKAFGYHSQVDVVNGGVGTGGFAMQISSSGTTVHQIGTPLSPPAILTGAVLVTP